MRMRIAADLHDDIGANLSSIALLSDTVRAHAALAEPQRRQLERISTSARTTLDDMRDIVWSIDPELDHFADLVAKMQDTAAVLLPGIRRRFHLPEAGVPARLSMSCRRDVFLAFKEALHNVARHARAQQVDIQISINGDFLTLVVCDDGVGMNGSSEGTGLKSLRNRADRLSGCCEIESDPGRGTTVRFEARLT
jgi:signal transduction histidine kinase